MDPFFNRYVIKNPRRYFGYGWLQFPSRSINLSVASTFAKHLMNSKILQYFSMCDFIVFFSSS